MPNNDNRLSTNQSIIQAQEPISIWQKTSHQSNTIASWTDLSAELIPLGIIGSRTETTWIHHQAKGIALLLQPVDLINSKDGNAECVELVTDYISIGAQFSYSSHQLDNSIETYRVYCK